MSSSAPVSAFAYGVPATGAIPLSRPLIPAVLVCPRKESPARTIETPAPNVRVTAPWVALAMAMFESRARNPSMAPPAMVSVPTVVNWSLAICSPPAPRLTEPLRALSLDQRSVDPARYVTEPVYPVVLMSRTPPRLTVTPLVLPNASALRICRAPCSMLIAPVNAP